MTVHAVKLSDLVEAKRAALERAQQILNNVDAVQLQLAQTDFIGENADALEAEMNEKMQTFVVASYDNVDELMRVANNNMRVVASKLGGGNDAEWAHVPMTQNTRQLAESQKGANSYLIDTDKMGDFAKLVTAKFEEIATSYTAFRNTVIDETPGWVGPEKDATRSAIDAALPQIIGAEGGTGVKGVGSSLSEWIVNQVRVMDSGGAGAPVATLGGAH